VLSHGPWPPPPALDAGNGVAGRADAVALGQRLFFDPRLSGDGRLACASCHAPALAFADGRARSQGREPLDRNAPSLWNAVHERWLGWDGAADSLWSQALRPLTDPRELASGPEALRRWLGADEDLACRWRQVFGAPAADDSALLVQAAKALGAFTGSLVSGPTPFDRFRDALARGDERAVARYPAARPCAGCSSSWARVVASCATPGRASATASSPTSVPASSCARARSTPVATAASRRCWAAVTTCCRRMPTRPATRPVKTRHVQLQHRNFGEFKVPGLRNVALTAPYLHDGQVATLAGMVQHYSELDLDRLHADGERILQPLQLTRREAADLLAFLQTLTDPGARRWQPGVLPRCR
jgi:cytochrome c peroxidase